MNGRLRTTIKAGGNPVVILGRGFFMDALAAALVARGHAAVAIDRARPDSLVAALPARPAAIVIDFLAARRDNFALLRALRRTSAYARVPVFVLSSGTVMDDGAFLTRQLRAFDAHPLLDPCDLDTLLASVAAERTAVA